MLALGIGIFALVRMIIQLKNKQMNMTQLMLGSWTTILIFALIFVVYVIKDEAYAFSPAFRIPLFTVFLPIIAYFVFNAVKTTTLKYIANVLLVNIAFSGIFVLGLYALMTYLLELVGVNLYY